jgi:hypothetical protein
VDESEMITTQVGKHNTSEVVTVLGTPCVIPRRNCNSREPAPKIAIKLLQEGRSSRLLVTHLIVNSESSFCGNHSTGG